MEKKPQLVGKNVLREQKRNGDYHSQVHLAVIQKPLSEAQMKRQT